jgi:addiction module HigA family antidote
MEAPMHCFPNRHGLARFFSKVTIAPAGCWLWTASKSPNGYGVFGFRGRSTSAHRIAYGWFVSPAAPREHVDHLCCNHGCVNPSHLEAVLPAENARRARKHRGPEAASLERMRRSPVHPGAILDLDILQPLGVTQTEAARRMGITLNRLNEILIGKRGVSAESAVLIGAVTGTSPQMWMRLQADYDLWHAMQTIDTSKIKRMKVA